jgi:phosphohistidine phosphatase
VILSTGPDATGSPEAPIPLPAEYDSWVIWLLRHGDAEDGSDDAARQLTDKGQRQAEWAGRALAALGVELDACLTSPKVRAMDTARVACAELGVEAEPESALEGGGFEIESVAAGRGEVLLVGHEPDFSNAIAAATGARVKLKKGGLAAVEDGQLHLLLRPADLKRIRA